MGLRLITSPTFVIVAFKCQYCMGVELSSCTLMLCFIFTISDCLVFTARCYAECGCATVCPPSVCLSVYMWRSGTMITGIGRGAPRFHLTQLSVSLWGFVEYRNHNHNHNNECSSALSTTVRPIVHYSVSWKTGALRALRKTWVESMFLVWGGMRFQIFGPQAENARFPNWVRVLMW